jgi:flagellar hook assembly protein FlgD
LVKTITGTGTDIVDFSWNGQDDNGNMMPSGTYIWKIKAGSQEKSGVTVLTK